MIGKKIRASKIVSGSTVSGTVELIYHDALASGSNEYISVTVILVRAEDGACYSVYPRDIIEIL